MTPHETVSTTTPGDARATAPLTRTFGPQGPDLGGPHRRLPPGLPGPAVPVPQHRPRPDRPSHRVLRPRRAGHRPDHLPDPPVSTRPACRRGGHRHHQPGDLGPPPHGHPRRPLGLARHRARVPPTASARIPPARASSSTPNTSPSASTCPPRGRTFSTSPTIPAGASRRSSASLGRRSTKPAASSGSRQGARRRWWDASSPSRRPLPRPWRDGGPAATPPARWSSTATAFPFAAGARRGAPPVRRPGCRPASSTIAGARPPAT